MYERDYKSPYKKTNYVGTIRLRNSETGKMEDVLTNRSVYQNSELNPYLVIPKGTKVGKETIKEDITNLERMSQGKSPLVPIKKEDGSISYERIELHHLTANELQPKTDIFNRPLQDGTIVEIKSSVHDAKQLHSLNEKNNSFRNGKVEFIDKEGKTVRIKKKSYDAYHYERFKKQYWKDRAYSIIQQEKMDRQNIQFDEQAQNSNKDMTKKNDMANQNNIEELYDIVEDNTDGLTASVNEKSNGEEESDAESLTADTNEKSNSEEESDAEGLAADTNEKTNSEEENNAEGLIADADEKTNGKEENNAKELTADTNEQSNSEEENNAERLTDNENEELTGEKEDNAADLTLNEKGQEISNEESKDNAEDLSSGEEYSSDDSENQDNTIDNNSEESNEEKYTF